MVITPWRAYTHTHTQAHKHTRKHTDTHKYADVEMNETCNAAAFAMPEMLMLSQLLLKWEIRRRIYTHLP
jgi:hypothetical protein